MKKLFIIISIFSASFLACLIGYKFYLQPAYADKHAKSVPFKLNCKTSFLLGKNLEKLLPDQILGSEKQIREQEQRVIFYSNSITERKLNACELAIRKQQLSSFRKCQKELVNKKTKHEVLRVKRIASSFIMNNPAYYKRDISNNNISEDGHGADNENIYMLYLSDGTVIKASPRVNPQWLGVKTGEKVLKTTSEEPVLHGDTYSVETVSKYTPLYE